MTGSARARMAGVLLACVWFAAAAALVAASTLPGRVGEPAQATTEEPAAAAVGVAALDRCAAQAGMTDDCVTAALIGTLEADGGAAAMQLLLEAGERNPTVGFACHAYAHEVGIAASDWYPSIEAAFSDGDPNCQFGYYHGVLIGVAGDIGDDAEFFDAVPELCSFFAAGSFSAASCVHGIGHAAAARVPGDVPRAAAACDALGEPAERDWCVTGVVMEWAATYVGEALRSGELTKADVEQVCDEFPAETLPSCLREASAAWLAVHASNVAPVMDLCDRFDGAAWEACYVGVGAKVAMLARLDTDTIVEMCGNGVRDGAGFCAGGAADGVFGQFYRSDPGRASQVCAAFDAPADQVCADRLQATLDGYEALASEVGETGYTSEIDVTGLAG